MSLGCILKESRKPILWSFSFTSLSQPILALPINLCKLLALFLSEGCILIIYFLWHLECTKMLLNLFCSVLLKKLTQLQRRQNTPRDTIILEKWHVSLPGAHRPSGAPCGPPATNSLFQMGWCPKAKGLAAERWTCPRSGLARDSELLSRNQRIVKRVTQTGAFIQGKNQNTNCFAP